MPMDRAHLQRAPRISHRGRDRAFRRRCRDGRSRGLSTPPLVREEWPSRHWASARPGWRWCRPELQMRPLAGDVVVSGSPPTAPPQFQVGMFTSGGAVNAAFGVGGTISSFPGFALAVAVDSASGDVVAAGYTTSSSQSCGGAGPVPVVVGYPLSGGPAFTADLRALTSRPVTAFDRQRVDDRDLDGRDDLDLCGCRRRHLRAAVFRPAPPSRRSPTRQRRCSRCPPPSPTTTCRSPSARSTTASSTR